MTMQCVSAQRVAEPLRSVERQPADEDRASCGGLRSRAAGIRIAHENFVAPASVSVGRKPAGAPPGAGIAPHAATDATPRAFRVTAAARGSFTYRFTQWPPCFGGHRERGTECAFDVEAAS